MDLTTWFWTYDRRWFFNIQIPYLDKIWIFPIIIDFALGVKTIQTLFFQNKQCLSQFGYVNWLETQLSFQIISIILISLLIYRFRKINKHDEKLFEHVNKTKASNPKNYKYWQIKIVNKIFKYQYIYFLNNYRIRTKGLLSILGFGVLSLAFIKFVWTWVGYILYTQHSLDNCNKEFRVTFLANFITPLVCLIPIGFTFIMFFLIKIFNILFSWLMPSTYIWISKRI